ncbi:hypothetical protein DE146DRAFT_162886 [Phaeosphaeria sp. MPI-PUGE-AT-0046c]|nr:hypothetical protein DE146DRAFT_162886 [Phaeosphaeria sp. MPI-PUGE-AT-0046c]
MLHSTFILSLLASATSARVLPRVPLLDDSVLPSFAIVSPGATIDPISSVAPIITATSTPTPVDEGLPAPYESTQQMPAYESVVASNAPAFTLVPDVPQPTTTTPCSTLNGPASPTFDRSNAPAFTPAPGAPTGNPVYSSTPCSTLDGPASPTFDPSNAPAFTPAPGAPTGNPVYPSTPCSTLGGPASPTFNPSNAPAFTVAPGAPTGNPVYPSTPCSTQAVATPLPETPTPKVPSNGKATPSPVVSPVQTPTYGNGQGEEAPCDGDDKTPSKPSLPIPFGSARPVNIPANGPPPFPTMIGRPDERPGFGWFRPRPSGAWPSRGAPRPTKGFGRPRPSAGFQLPSKPSASVGANKGNAASTPCTLETRVRPTPTAF